MIYKNFCDTIPDAFIDSAKMDGANGRQIFSQIILPVTIPATMGIMVFQSIAYLGNYVWQTLILQSESHKTLLSGIIWYTTQRGNASEIQVNVYGIQMAGGVILLIPVMLIFVLSSKYFTKGLTGGVKG